MNKSFLFVPVFLLLCGCSTLNGVDYSKIESFDVVLRDVEGQILNCTYQRGFSVNCKKDIKNEKTL